MAVTYNEAKALGFFQKYPGHLKTATSDIAERLEISEEEVKTGRRVYREQEKSEKSNTNWSSNATEGVRERVEAAGVAQSYEEFLDHHGIDEEDVTNVWFKQKASGTYFSVETRKYKDEELPFDPVEELKTALVDYVPDYPRLDYNIPTKRIGFINLFDAHLGKISSIDVTDEERTVEDNVKLFQEAFFELLENVAVKKPEKIVIPVGNDLFHVNDDSLSTKKGTFLGDSMGMRSADEFRLGLNIVRYCIDKASKVAPVEIYVIRGNHDNDKVLYLLECLIIAYENNPNVTVHDSRKTRQYHRYGDWLFGFAHGDNQRKASDLPSLMSTDEDSRKHWSEVKRGIYFLGDVHHETRHDFRGCTVMYLRSTSTTDQWHWEKGFTAIPKTAYAFIYDKDAKREHEFKVNI